MLSDADLVRAAQGGGDATSLGLLLERHRAALYGQALGILGYGPRPRTPSTTPSWWRRSGDYEVYKMTASGLRQTNISNNPASDLGPDWQPLQPLR